MNSVKSIRAVFGLLALIATTASSWARPNLLNLRELTTNADAIVVGRVNASFSARLLLKSSAPLKITHLQSANF